MNTSCNFRKEWIDALRAIAIILVVSGHCLPGKTDFFAFTNPIKMPLFFAISGYLFKENIDLQSFIKKLSKKILVPWLLLGGLITFCIASIQREAFLDGLCKMLTGDFIWWFLPCFFLGELIHYALRRVFVNDALLLLFSFLCFFLGQLFCKYNLFDFMMINRAFVVQIFFCLGYIIKKNEHLFSLHFIETKGPSVNKCLRLLVGGGILVGYILGCLFCIYNYPGSCIDVRANNYLDINYSLIMIVVGVWLSFMFAKIKTNYPAPLLFIGKNTFTIYIFHIWFINATIRIEHLFNINVGNPYLDFFLLFIISLLSSCIMSKVLNRYAPWLVGKS